MVGLERSGGFETPIMSDPPYTVGDWPSSAAYAEALRRDGFYVALERSPHRGASPLCQAIFGDAERPKRRSLRPTQGVSGLRFRELHQAVSFANLKGHVLNTFVTIAWSTLAISSDAQIGAARREFVELMRHWLKEWGILCSWIWVDE